ncbi:hypothetical protein J1614_011111 [Plenodomus biglobosus]|nr:hypothetical protein J1614_011111 [Plenodomus biglobosus]
MEQVVTLQRIAVQPGFVSAIDYEVADPGRGIGDQEIIFPRMQTTVHASHGPPRTLAATDNPIHASLGPAIGSQVDIVSQQSGNGGS